MILPRETGRPGFSVALSAGVQVGGTQLVEALTLMPNSSATASGESRPERACAKRWRISGAATR
jgi:hypothetical protein